MRSVLAVLILLFLNLPPGAGALDSQSLDAARAAAQAKLNAGDFAGARDAYQAILRDIPDHPGVQLRFAQSLVGLQ